MTLSTIIVAIVVGIMYFVLPLIVWIIGKNKKTKVLVKILLGVYLIALFFGVTSKIVFKGMFVTISLDYSMAWADKVINWSMKNIDLFDMVINIVMLIPIGLYIIFMSNKYSYLTIIKLLVTGFMFGLIIETMQFTFPIPRSVQISDIMFNCVSVCLGGGLGWLYNYISYKIQMRKSKK